VHQADLYDLGLCDDSVPLTGKRLPAVVGHKRIEAAGRGELQKLDLQRLPVSPAAPGPLQNPAAVLGSNTKDVVLISDQAILGVRSRPQKNTKRQAHGADLRDGTVRMAAECPSRSVVHRYFAQLSGADRPTQAALFCRRPRDSTECL
jgi:hypothetical protein